MIVFYVDWAYEGQHFRKLFDGVHTAHEWIEKQQTKAPLSITSRWLANVNELREFLSEGKQIC